MFPFGQLRGLRSQFLRYPICHRLLRRKIGDLSCPDHSLKLYQKHTFGMMAIDYSPSVKISHFFFFRHLFNLRDLTSSVNLRMIAALDQSKASGGHDLRSTTAHGRSVDF